MPSSCFGSSSPIGKVALVERIGAHPRNIGAALGSVLFAGRVLCLLPPKQKASIAAGSNVRRDVLVVMPTVGGRPNPEQGGVLIRDRGQGRGGSNAGIGGVQLLSERVRPAVDSARTDQARHHPGHARQRCNWRWASRPAVGSVRSRNCPGRSTPRPKAARSSSRVGPGTRRMIFL